MQSLKKTLIYSLVSLSTLMIYSCNSVNQSTNLIPLDTNVTAQSAAQNDPLSEVNLAASSGQIINGVFHGTVTERLADDTSGLKHEKFMFKIIDGLNGKYNGQTVLVAHDTDRAPEVPLSVGDKLEIKGDFLPDATPDKVLHWTHHDEKHKHADGYIILNGKKYE